MVPVVVLVVVALVAVAGGPKPDDPTGNTPGWDMKPPAADARPAAAKAKRLGIDPAGSRIKDQEALGGFGPYDNVPMDLAGKEWGTQGAVAIVAFPDETVD
jgi:hypothetical protein